MRAFNCPICNKGFYTPEDVNSHIKIVHNAVKSGCSVCGSSFKDLRSHKAHLIRVCDSLIMCQNVVALVTLHWTQMADGILKFMIGHLGLGSNVQLGLMDFKVLLSVNRDWF